MKLNFKSVDFDIETGLAPVRIGSVTCSVASSELVSQSHECIREVYRTSSGGYWLHVLVPGVGHYAAVLSGQEASGLIALNEMSNGVMPQG